MHQGKCLCGKVKVSARELSSHISTCHCGMCRKWTGSMLMSVDAKTSNNFKYSPEDMVSKYQSSEWAERGFCKECGTSLFYHSLYDDNFFVPIGLFDDVEDAVFEEEIFIDKKPYYYEFANNTKKLTEADILSQFNK